jgi:hypothetical protein
MTGDGIQARFGISENPTREMRAATGQMSRFQGRNTTKVTGLRRNISPLSRHWAALDRVISDSVRDMTWKC